MTKTITDERLGQLMGYASDCSKPWICVEVVEALQELRDRRTSGLTNEQTLYNLMARILACASKHSACADDPEFTKLAAEACEIRAPSSAEPSADALDAARYRWLRDGNAYAPEEDCTSGGEDLDHLCDRGIRAAQNREGSR